MPTYRQSSAKAPSLRYARGGFALPVALALFSLIFLCLLTLSLRLRVETVGLQQASLRLQAREHARLALLMAMGELQTAAGPDQRVTFPAGALEPPGSQTIAHPHWTGVHDTRSTSSTFTDYRWLVSGQGDPRHALPASTSIQLHPAIPPAAAAVQAPLVPVGTSGGHYAYWIADESLKASLAASPQEHGQLAAKGSTQALSQQVIPPRVGIERLFASNELGLEVEGQELARLQTRAQLGLASAWNLRHHQADFHHVTTRSHGVLASTTGSGLRKDLSLAPGSLPLPGAFARLADFTGYLEQPLAAFNRQKPYLPYADDLRRRHHITAPSEATAGQVADGVYPLLTDFRILLHLHVAGSDVIERTGQTDWPITDPRALVLKLQLHLELWNPYSSALVPEDLVLVLEGLPEVKVELRDARGRTLRRHQVDLADLLDNGTRSHPGYHLRLPFTERGYSNHDDLSWLPGRVYNWVGPNNYARAYGQVESLPTARFYSRTLNQSIWYLHAGITAPVGTHSIRLEGEPARLTLSLRQLAPRDRLPGGPLLWKIEGITFDDFATADIPASQRGARFGYHLQRYESGFTELEDDAWAKSAWLRTEDPRATTPTFDPSGQTPAAFYPPNGIDPTAYRWDTAIAVAERDYLFDRTAGADGLHPREDLPLFELLREPPLSIGQLQHLHIIGERPNAIGNSWGSEKGARYNCVFDQCFFSGLQAAHSPEVPSPPHHRLGLAAWASGGTPPALEDLLAAGENSSHYLLTEGAFNINSTSARAWQAVLGSLALDDWEYVPLDDATGEMKATGHRQITQLGPSALHFPQSAQEVFHLGQEMDEPHPPTEFFRRGARSLTEDDWAELGQAVSQRVAERIRALGPFESMEAFLAGVPLPAFRDPDDPQRHLSVLERAILDLPSINQINHEEIWHHTPARLSQADLMTALAPIAHSRGDTFLIRAYGQANDPMGAAAAAHAYCEARVQRLPETLDPGDNPSRPSPQGLGRRFAMTHFRWLNPEDLQ